MNNFEGFTLPTAKPTKMYVAGVKIRQFIYRNSTSAPYISSDALHSLCEISYPYHENELTEEFVERLFSARKVFCPSHLAAQMLERFSDRMNAELLIFSNSDHEFHEAIPNFPATIKLVLMENSYISDNILTFTLPIGVENLSIGMNGMKSLFDGYHRKKKINELLVGPFSPTHSIRGEVVRKFLSEKGPWRVVNVRMNPKKYAKLSATYRYIACVRGNSVESHRLWETLYRGSIPLVLRDKWAESLEFLRLPILLVESWDPSQIKEVINSGNLQSFDPQQLPSLWIPFWEDFINKKLEA